MIILSIKFKLALHTFGILTITNYALLYIAAIELEGDELLLNATDKAFFVVFCIVLFVLNTQWIIQTPIVLFVYLFNVYYFNEEIEHEIEEHGPIEYITISIITILPLVIVGISYIIRKVQILIFLDNDENKYLRNENL